MRIPKTALLIIIICCLVLKVEANNNKHEILIGTHLPLSGMMAAVGWEQKWAYEEAVKDINAAGGIFVSKYNRKLPVRLIVVDDKTNPALAAVAVENLILQCEVDMILGGHTAAFGVIPGCLVAEKYGVYYQATGCYSDIWLEHKFKNSTLFFYDLQQGSNIPFLIWETLAPETRPQKIALLAEDTFDARVMMDALRLKVFENGYEVALEKYWAPQTHKDLALTEGLITSGADGLFIFGTTEDCIRLIQAVSKTDLNLKYIHCWRGGWSKEFGAALGSEAQYIVSDGHWSEDFPYTGAKALGQRYEAKFKDKSVSVGAFYASAQILFQAIEEAGTLEAPKIRLQVLTSHFNTVMGPVKYHDFGVAHYPSSAFQWIDGSLQLIYIQDSSLTPLQTPIGMP